jgi:LysM repeat protein
MNLQRFATAGPSAGSGRMRRKRTPGQGQGRPAAVVCPLRRSVRPRRPARSALAKRSALAPPPAAPLVAPALTVKYVVQPGDTLHRLAQRFDTTARLLAVLNGLHKPALLVPGATLLVPERVAERNSE